MQIQRITSAECEELYRTALPRDFPAAELKPFSEIQRLLDAGVYEPLLLTDDTGTRLAYAWLVVLPAQRTALLDYFAVRYDLRGGGVGTAAGQGILRYAGAGFAAGVRTPRRGPRPGRGAAAHRVLSAGWGAGHSAGKPGVRHTVHGALAAVRRHRARCTAL